MKRIDAKTVLIVTNRPAIANSWYSDYARFIGRESGYFFVSSVDGIADKPNVISYKTYDDDAKSREERKLPPVGLIDFVSLQDLKGSVYFGGHYNKLSEIKKIKWDLLVIDEAHEGVDTYKTDVALTRLAVSLLCICQVLRSRLLQITNLLMTQFSITPMQMNSPEKSLGMIHQRLRILMLCCRSLIFIHIRCLKS